MNWPLRLLRFLLGVVTVALFVPFLAALTLFGLCYGKRINITFTEVCDEEASDVVRGHRRGGAGERRSVAA